MGALKQHAQRVHMQARVCGRASVAHHQEFIDQLQNGSTLKTVKPHATNELPAPTAINEMVICHCKGKCSMQKCGCKSHNLACTDICLCNNEGQNDDDVHADDDLNGPLLR